MRISFTEGNQKNIQGNLLELKGTNQGSVGRPVAAELHQPMNVVRAGSEGTKGQGGGGWVVLWRCNPTCDVGT